MASGRFSPERRRDEAIMKWGNWGRPGSLVGLYRRGQHGRSHGPSGRRKLGQVAAALAVLVSVAVAGQVALAQGGAVFSQEEICKTKYQTGQEYLRNQRLLDAAAAFSEVKEACPRMLAAYVNLAYIQTQMGQYHEAIATCEDALDEDPGNLDIKESMAFALSSAGQLDDAIALYLELHAARPEKPEIMRNLAFVYEKKGLVAEAVMLYNRLIELGNADPVMMAQAGRMALNKKLFFPAVAFYRVLYESNPNDVATPGILGGYYYKIKFYAEAIPYYEKILEIAPGHAQALLYHKILMDCYKRTKQHDKAVTQAEYVITQEPDNPANYCNLATIYKEAKNAAKAVEAIRRGLEVDPNTDCLHYAWGMVMMDLEATTLVNMKRYDEAIATLEEAKRAFERVIDLNGRYASYARQQIGRIDQLIERVLLLKERDESGN
jgi:tetratricopeptide (TPR) repeat protein